MHGWIGKILRINLTQAKYVIEDLDPNIANDFIGTRGLATKYLYDEIDPRIDAYSPENKLIFATGPLTGTGIIGSGRFMVLAKSPLIDGVGSANSGGYFGAEMKYAGYDMIIIEGRSHMPVYIMINNDKVEIKKAEHLWSRFTSETEQRIKQEATESGVTGEIQVCEIGPAGENLSRIASIQHFNDHTAARCGLGAVMGSKNLKAIAVRGSGNITIAKPAEFTSLVQQQLETIRESPMLERRPIYGTWTGISRAYKFGVMSTKNAQLGQTEENMDGAEKILRQNHWVHSSTCFSCPFQEMKTTISKFMGTTSSGGGLEWETWDKLGPECDVTDFDAICRASHLCNEYGLDTISAGGTIACAMELSEKKFIPQEEIGYQLSFGDAEAMIDLIEKMGKRQGFGDIIAEGAFRLANRYQHPELFMGSKKLEFPGWHPQGFQILALGYATGNRGACHLKNITYYSDSRFETQGQAVIAKADQDYIAAMESAGLCHSLYVRDFIIWRDLLATILDTVTGAGYNQNNTLLAGERIWNIEKLFNIRAGLSAKEDCLPKRILEEPMPAGPSKGNVAKLDKMLPEYYTARGWDKNGIPIKRKLDELHLSREGEKLYA